MVAKPFSELRDEHYAQHPQSRERVAQKVAQLREELGLAALRQRTQRTQTEVADAMGRTQAGISRLEAQDDAKVSTLRSYIAATGGRLRLLAEYPDGEYELSLGEASPSAPEQQFAVIWQDPHTRRFVHVGRLVVTAHGRFVFAYTEDAELNPRFEPFPDLPDLRDAYESDELFPAFAERVVAPPDEGDDPLARALGLSREGATPVELLARSAGASRPDDVLQIIPEPQRVAPDLEVRRFLVSGCRHVDDDTDAVSGRIAGLEVGAELHLVDEPANPANPRAIRLDDATGQPVGWVPDHLLDYVRKSRSDSSVRVFVERANGPSVAWHLRILARMERQQHGPDERRSR